MKNKRFTAKILIDIGMTICLLLLMPYSLLSETAHEWIGMAMLVLFIAHHMLNRKWLLSIGKGKYNAFRVIQTVLVIIMFILMSSEHGQQDLSQPQLQVMVYMHFTGDR